MIRNHLLSAVALVGLFAGGPAALAASTNVAAPASVATATQSKLAKPIPAHLKAQYVLSDEREVRSWTVGKAEMTALGDARVPLAQAIATAEKATRGRAIEAAFAHRGDRLVYLVDTYRDGRVTKAEVDAMSGAIVHQGKPVRARDFVRRDRTEIAALRNASGGLSTAVETAEKELGGKALAAGIETYKGGAAYTVSVAKGGTVQRLLVGLENTRAV